MKKQISLIAITALTVSLTSCGSNTPSQPAQGVIIQQPINTATESSTAVEVGGVTKTTGETLSSDDKQTAAGSNILIAYFTVPETDGVDAVASASRVVTADGVLGNTEFVAIQIQKNLGGDLFAIETVQEYPGTHDKLLEFAYNEKSDNARPELFTHIDNLDSYDYIFVGFPNWNADLPMPLYSFFDEYDFSGKTIIPFVTHGGSGFSRTIQTIAQLEPGATVIDNGLSVSRNSVADAKDDIKKWTDSLIKQ